MPRATGPAAEVGGSIGGECWLVIRDDHGEMLGGKGEPMGHGWLLNPELVNAPLIIMDPAKPVYRVNPRMGCQVDLLPTVLDLLGIPVPHDQLYEGRSLLEKPGSGEWAWLNSYGQYAVAATNTLIFGDRESPQQSKAAPVYKLHNEGARTLFEQTRTAPFPASIEDFDKFQENLLRNYGLYCRTVGALRSPTVASGK